jgi:hypothetical protein
MLSLLQPDYEEEFMGCCLVTIFFGLISRIALIFWYIFDTPRFTAAFNSWQLPGTIFIPAWLYTLVGGIVLPWTTLAYVYVSPHGVTAYEWIIIGIGVVIDLTTHGGSYRHRRHFPLFR